MRIAYVTIHIAPEIMQGGVGRKIRTQMDAWMQMGHQVHLFSVNPALVPFQKAHQFVFDSQGDLFKREFNRYAALRKMLRAVSDYAPDLIYLRFGLYSYPLHLLFEISPVIIEMNSYDLVEYRQRGLFFYWANRLTRNLTLDPARGYVVATRELMNLLALNPKKPSCIIANGVDLKDLRALPAPNNVAPVITLVGSPGMNWHGVDKLIEFARLFPDIKINIVGFSREEVSSSIPGNVDLHGFLNGDQIRVVLSETDVACGTLALHRKDMNEASPLKVREALACGIPVVLAYKDTDLDQIDLDTILRIPNTEDNVIQHAEEIRDFAYRMMGKRVDINTIGPYVDQRRKENDRLRFFQMILESRI